MKYKLAVFDLDGTILNTVEDLADSVNYALRKYGLPERTLEQTRKLLGNGMKNLCYGSTPEGTPEEIRQAVLADFREYYGIHCMDKTRPYEGIHEMFANLRGAGIHVVVLSNKGDSAVQTLMDHYYSGELDGAYGERQGIRRKPWPDALQSIMEAEQVLPTETVYIGDSEVDIETGKNAGVDCIIVEWGFRSRDFRIEAGAEHLAADVPQLEQMIRGQQS